MNKIFYTFSTIDDGNIAFHVSENHKEVIENQKKLCKKHNLHFDNLKYMNQIHSNSVQIVDKSTQCYDNCDGIITNKIDTPLMVMVADCIPILFYEENKNIIGVAHAGRNGTYQNISANMINAMINTYDIEAKNIKVVLGPSIQKCCYEVSPELATIAKKSFGDDIVDGRFVDLQAINKKQLLACGVEENNIQVSNICTKCSNKGYYSYRVDKTCGRFCGIISLIK